jgi:hypothetical protein
MILWNLGE